MTLAPRPLEASCDEMETGLDFQPRELSDSQECLHVTQFTWA